MFGAKNICENLQLIYDSVKDMEDRMDSHFKTVYNNQLVLNNRLEKIESMLTKIYNEKQKQEENNHD